MARAPNRPNDLPNETHAREIAPSKLAGLQVVGGLVEGAVAQTVRLCAEIDGASIAPVGVWLLTRGSRARLRIAAHALETGLVVMVKRKGCGVLLGKAIISDFSPKLV